MGSPATMLEGLTPRPVPLRESEDGILRVGKTRVTLETVLAAFQNGAGAEGIVLKYPSLDITDVYAVIVYYLWNRPTVDRYLEARQREEDATQVENEQRFPPHDVKARLVERHSQLS